MLFWGLFLAALGGYWGYKTFIPWLKKSFQKLRQKALSVFQGSDPVTTGQSKKEGEAIFCDVCGQGPMDQKSHLRDHKEAQHSESDTAREVSRQDYEVSRSDLVDDYEADWLEDDEDDGIELAEPTGGVDQELRQKKLRKKWQPLLIQLRKDGKAVLRQDAHLGSLRGGNITEEFKRDVKRMDLDFEVKIEYRGHDHDSKVIKV